MAYRPSWQGHLKLSLVSCPVAMYTATNAAGDVHFHLINPKTNNRIRMIPTDPDSGPVERSSLVKGFEVGKDEYILVSDEEIKSVKLESTKVIEIERFVPVTDIDRVYWDHPYFLTPDGEMAQEAFGVIRDAMERSGRLAIGRVVLSTRERIVAIEPRGKGLLAYTLRTREEVRDSDAIFDKIDDPKLDESMIAIAEKIIESKATAFDPSQFKDRYENALKALIDAKRQGHKVETMAETSDTNVVDLMAALKASLAGKADRMTSPKTGASRKAAAKPKAATTRRKKAS